MGKDRTRIDGLPWASSAGSRGSSLVRTYATLFRVCRIAGNLPRHQTRRPRDVSDLHTERPRQAQDTCPFSLPEQSTRRRSPSPPLFPFVSSRSNRQGRAAASKAAPARRAAEEACRPNPIALKVFTATPPNRNGPLFSSFLFAGKLADSILSSA